MSKIIAFCGLDGSGKTTQIRFAEQYLSKSKYRVAICKLPTDWYRSDGRVRDLLDEKIDNSEPSLSEFALLAACDRQRWTNTELHKMKGMADVILCDRHVFSTYAYFLARGYTDINWLISINRHIAMPDLTFYIDVPSVLAVERVKQRDGKERKQEEVNIAKMDRVRNIFLQQPWGKSDTYRIIDGTMSPAEVEHSIVQEINKFVFNNSHNC